MRLMHVTWCVPVVAALIALSCNSRPIAHPEATAARLDEEHDEEFYKKVAKTAGNQEWVLGILVLGAPPEACTYRHLGLEPGGPVLQKHLLPKGFDQNVEIECAAVAKDGLAYATCGDALEFVKNGAITRLYTAPDWVVGMSFSPDSKTLFFIVNGDEKNRFRRQRLMVADMATGNVRKLMVMDLRCVFKDLSMGRGRALVWLDNEHVVLDRADGQLVSIDINTGDVKPLCKGRWPVSFRDGKLFAIRYDDEGEDAELISHDMASSKEERVLTIRGARGVGCPGMSPDGEWLILNANVLTHGGKEPQPHMYVIEIRSGKSCRLWTRYEFTPAGRPPVSFLAEGIFLTWETKSGPGR